MILTIDIGNSNIVLGGVRGDLCAVATGPGRKDFCSLPLYILPVAVGHIHHHTAHAIAEHFSCVNRAAGW